MSFFLTVGGALAVFFILSYVRAGRFGSTILALGAGYLLATMWVDTLVTYESIYLPGVSMRDVSYGLLIVVPGLLAMLFAIKQKSLLPRIVQAFAIAVLGVALLLPVLAFGGGHVSELYKLIESNRDMVITVLLLLGLLDIVLSRSEKTQKPSKH